jgi:hypothetical protein
MTGRQERWYLWRPWAAAPGGAAGSRLGPSTVHYRLDAAGQRAAQAIRRGLANVPNRDQPGSAGLRAKLEKTQAVLLSDLCWGRWNRVDR